MHSFLNYEDASDRRRPAMPRTGLTRPSGSACLCRSMDRMFTNLLKTLTCHIYTTLTIQQESVQQIVMNDESRKLKPEAATSHCPSSSRASLHSPARSTISSLAGLTLRMDLVHA